MTVGGLKSRVSLWAFPLLCDKAVISIKCRTFYVPLREAKRQRVNRGHGENRGRESIKKCFLLHQEYLRSGFHCSQCCCLLSRL